MLAKKIELVFSYIIIISKLNNNKMTDNKIALIPSIIKHSLQTKSDYKIAKVHPAPSNSIEDKIIDAHQQQVSLYERWNIDSLDYKATPSVAVEHKQVSINDRWLDDCVG